MARSFLLLFILVAGSCRISERPIVYGSDDCAYCKMTVMDHRYGSELVTEKGKVLTFDAAECLIEYVLHNEDIADHAHALLVTPYTFPNSLIDAKEAAYLVSGKLPSPMGAYLTALPDKETAKEFQNENGGSIYTWEELLVNLRTIRLKAIEEFE
jgi:copper chaperone NosL